MVSRGDRSGTHQAEIALWQAAGVDIAKDKGPWYRDIGQGMGAALNAAAATNAYVLADRGTWISFKNRGSLAIAVEGDRRLFNQYGIILVNPDKFPHVKKDEPIGYARRLGRRRSPIIASGENSSSFPTLRHAGPDPTALTGAASVPTPRDNASR